MATDLYDRSGYGVAYIHGDNQVIYLGSGEAVAYLDGEHAWGFNGAHLGWFTDGRLYDDHGAPVGFTQAVCPVATSAPPSTVDRQGLPERAGQGGIPGRPGFGSMPSQKDLEAFLRKGR